MKNIKKTDTIPESYQKTCTPRSEITQPQDQEEREQIVTWYVKIETIDQDHEGEIQWVPLRTMNYGNHGDSPTPSQEENMKWFEQKQIQYHLELEPQQNNQNNFSAYSKMIYDAKENQATQQLIQYIQEKQLQLQLQHLQEEIPKMIFRYHPEQTLDLFPIHLSYRKHNEALYRNSELWDLKNRRPKITEEKEPGEDERTTNTRKIIRKDCEKYTEIFIRKIQKEHERTNQKVLFGNINKYIEEIEMKIWDDTRQRHAKKKLSEFTQKLKERNKTTKTEGIEDETKLDEITLEFLFSPKCEITLLDTEDALKEVTRKTKETIEKEKLAKVDKKAEGYLQKAYASSKRLAVLVKDLLNVSRIEGGRVVVQWQAFDINELQVRIKSLIEQRRKLQLKFSSGDFIPKREEKKLNKLDEQFMNKLMGIIDLHIAEEE